MVEGWGSSLGLRVRASRLRVQDESFRVWGLGLQV
jgi:hypothetical protein